MINFEIFTENVKQTQKTNAFLNSESEIGGTNLVRSNILVFTSEKLQSYKRDNKYFIK